MLAATKTLRECQNAGNVGLLAAGFSAAVSFADCAAGFSAFGETTSGLAIVVGWRGTARAAGCSPLPGHSLTRERTRGNPSRDSELAPGDIGGAITRGRGRISGRNAIGLLALSGGFLCYWLGQCDFASFRHCADCRPPSFIRSHLSCADCVGLEED